MFACALFFPSTGSFVDVQATTSKCRFVYGKLLFLKSIRLTDFLFVC